MTTTDSSVQKQFPKGLNQITISGVTALVCLGRLFVDGGKRSLGMLLTGLFPSSVCPGSDNFFGITDKGELYHFYLVNKQSLFSTLIARPVDRSEPEGKDGILRYNDLFFFKGVNALIFVTDDAIMVIGSGKVYCNGQEVSTEDTEMVCHRIVMAPRRTSAKRVRFEKEKKPEPSIKPLAMKSSLKSYTRLEIIVNFRKLANLTSENNQSLYRIETADSKIVVINPDYSSYVIYPEFEKRDALCCISTLPSMCSIDRVFPITRDRVYYWHSDGSLWLQVPGQPLEKFANPGEWIPQCSGGDLDLRATSRYIPAMIAVTHSFPRVCPELYRLPETIPTESFSHTTISFYNVKIAKKKIPFRLILILGSNISMPSLEYHITDTVATGTVVIKLNHSTNFKILSCDWGIIVANFESGTFYSYTFHQGIIGVYPKEKLFQLIEGQRFVSIGSQGLILDKNAGLVVDGCAISSQPLSRGTGFNFRTWNGKEILLTDVEGELSNSLEDIQIL